MVSGDRGAAQILFFTGVRYQRWSEDARAAPARQAQGVRRKRQAAEAGGGRKGQR
jgi:hypothetical protein